MNVLDTNSQARPVHARPGEAKPAWAGLAHDVNGQPKRVQALTIALSTHRAPSVSLFLYMIAFTASYTGPPHEIFSCTSHEVQQPQKKNRNVTKRLPSSPSVLYSCCACKPSGLLSSEAGNKRKTAKPNLCLNDRTSWKRTSETGQQNRLDRTDAGTT